MQDVSFKLTPAVLEILDRLILPPNLPCIHVGMLVGCLVDFYRIARVFRVPADNNSITSSYHRLCDIHQYLTIFKAFNKHRDFLEGLATQGEGLYGIAGIFPGTDSHSPSP